jgi:Fanconi anemia group M protein
MKNLMILQIFRTSILKKKRSEVLMADVAFMEHPLIQKDSIESRLYQAGIAQACKKRSTLVVLPTGLGKTVIALMVIADVLERKQGKILFLAPTKPLVQQHTSFLKEHLLDTDIEMFTGEVSPSKRKKLWEENTIIISTPQVIQNDLISGKFNLRDVGLIIFDEAHRATGDYAYTFIGRRYAAEGARQLTLGITASPGNNKTVIIEVCQNLGIEAVEIRSEYDPDVLPYVHEIKIDWIHVNISSGMFRALSLYNGILKDKFNILRRFGLLPKKKFISTREIIAVQGMIQGRLKSEGPRAPKALYHAARVQAQAMKINHAIELLETQGLNSLRNYIERLEKEASSRSGTKAAKDIVSDRRFVQAKKALVGKKEEHPKLEYVKKVVSHQLRKNPGSKVIVFTHYRDTSKTVTDALEEMDSATIRPVRFVGQATHGKDKGLSQKKQAELLDQFRRGEKNALVATSVAEEGLDIPSTDLVVFYEPVPSEIRMIQRRGRTGRHRIGRVVILITKGTRDEAYYWSARNKEKRMMKELRDMKEELAKHLVVDESIDISKELRALGLEKYDTPVEKEEASEDDILDEFKEDGLGEEVWSGEGNGTLNDSTEGALDESDDSSVSPTQASGEEERVGDSDFSSRVDPEEKKDEQTEKSTPGPVKGGQAKLLDFQAGSKSDDTKIQIIVDAREFKSKVVVELSNLGIVVEQQQLEVGDYVVSDRCGIERKEVEDFLQSLIDKRLFPQVKRLVQAYSRPVMILEGEGLFMRRRISQEAIMGALSSIAVSFKLPIVSTSDPKETAKFISVLAKKEYQAGVPLGTRGQKGHMSTKERQEFVVEGLPNVSVTIAKRLLAHFGTVENITNASIKELCQVKGVGKQTAKEIRDVLEAKYPDKAE